MNKMQLSADESDEVLVVRESADFEAEKGNVPSARA
jgi:hypothetical protein